MSPELDEKLVEKYPNIFADRYEAPQKTAMCWGFSCGDGWYNLIDTLCFQLESYIEHTKKHGIEPCPPITATQVKEKFGTLRFYYRGGDETTYHIVSFAEEMSARICEECGCPGKSRDGGWVRTLCDTHAEEFNY